MAQATTNEIIIPPKEECISKDDPRKFLIISYDLEMTGLEPQDEIIQIGAYHAADPGGQSTFSQFVLPATRKVYPEASLKIGLQVEEKYNERVLIDTRSGKQLETTSEENALVLFYDWLKLQLQNQNGRYDRIVMVSHGAIFLDIPALVHALRRLNMTEQFYKIVSGFCDSNGVFQHDLKGCNSFSLDGLYRCIMGRRRQGQHRAEMDARDLYLLLLCNHYDVNRLSLQKCKSLAHYTYTTNCMEQYVNWLDKLQGRRQGLQVLLNYVYKSEKIRKIFIKNLLTAGYDMPTLEKDFFETAGCSVEMFSNNLRHRINQMKREHESYLTDTKGVSAEEIIFSVNMYFNYNKGKYHSLKKKSEKP